jgi:cytidylate kinase
VSTDPDTLQKVVAIDGPAGAGKSSVAREAASRLGMRFLDTGAMYRAATWRALHHQVDVNDPDALAMSTQAMALSLEPDNSGLRVMVDGQDVTSAIRSPEVTRSIRYLDGIPAVRERLVELQRAFAAQGPTVAEGRDMGTIVFPHARCKIFLDASVDERTRRRARQLKSEGRTVDLAALKSEIAERDHNDRSRAVAPLRPADEARTIDTTGMTFEQVVDTIVSLARESGL